MTEIFWDDLWNELKQWLLDKDMNSKIEVREVIAKMDKMDGVDMI